MSTKGSNALQMTQEQYEARKAEAERIEKELFKLSEERREADFHADHEGIPDSHMVDLERRESILNERKVAIQEILNNAVIIEKKENTNVVGIGSVVFVQVNGEPPKWLTLVSCSPDVFNGEVSLASPIGAAINGKKVDSLVTYQGGDGSTFTAKILKIK